MLFLGLQIQVECSPIRELVFLDRDMYEKIIMNLISNAYKFTTDGKIVVRVREVGKQAVQVSIEDSGCGKRLQ